MAATLIATRPTANIPTYTISGGGRGVQLSLDGRTDLTFDNNKVVGSGSFGKVYEATYNEEPCVIKVSGNKDSIMREVETYQRLSGDKSVASMKTYGHFEINGDTFHFIVMEQGIDFNQYATKNSLHRQAPELKQYAAKKLLAMVNDFHKTGHMHNDIKSTNIIITGKPDEPKGKFIDLDRVTDISDGPTVCTPGTCAPPEQLERWSYKQGGYTSDFPEGYDPTLIDSFATGCMLALKFYGKYPFDCDWDKGDIHGDIRKMSVEAHAAQLKECEESDDNPLWTAILRLTHPDPTRRSTVAEALASLETTL